MTKHSGNDDFNFLNNLCRFSLYSGTGLSLYMTGHRRITNLVLTRISQTWGIKLPKHIKMNIDIDTYEIDLTQKIVKINDVVTIFNGNFRGIIISL
jgi:hypothetical protein